MEVILNKENFEKEVLNEEKLVLIDFWATWCGPCQMIAPVIEDIANSQKDKVKVCKVNVDDEQELAIKYWVMSIPTLLFMKNGEPIKTVVGFHSKSELEEIINSL